ncbi:hypothetical protein J5J10_18060 [Ciceribacter sp. L1K23]|uniref:hypothetical protein n=1 Tax=Ciceribacter sp. L1K23 TaxID=2820276 RepID=UPI001B8249B5|nr:hypothetical protein [Ciceribacter sp. L1K23]MBR0557594.1 hypothetical protein [Ciceribacter sp. L1K23]
MNTRSESPKKTYPERREHPATPTEARQGSIGRPVLIVLLGGLIIAMLVWIPAEWWGSSIAPPEENAVEQAYPENTIEQQPSAQEQRTQPEAGN